MPLYFFETDDGELFDHDPVGLDLVNDSAAREAALLALPDMARENMPNGDHRTFVSTVRNEAGDIIYSAVMNVVGRWHTAKVIPIRAR